MTAHLNVLVVDDSSGARTFLAGLLAAAGYHVVTAHGARDGLRRLRSFRPDVILTDYNMPFLSGYDFVRLLRRAPDFLTTPVFVVSGENAWEKRLLMDQAGANAWFPKPLDPVLLLISIAAVAPLGQRRSLTITQDTVFQPIRTDTRNGPIAA